MVSPSRCIGLWALFCLPAVWACSATEVPSPPEPSAAETGTDGKGANREPSAPTSGPASRSEPGALSTQPATPDAGTSPGSDPGDLAGPIGGARPAEVFLPDGYDGSTKKYPLLLLLHGYSVNGAVEDYYLGMGAAARQRGYIYVLPDGTLDANNKRFWNATDACCNFGKQNVDDVAYIDKLLRQVSARYAVDTSRVYIFGHSNGGFMAHRFACEKAGSVTAIASLAGMQTASPNGCTPQRAVAVLQVHGTQDATIAFNGGSISQGSPPKPVPYPSAEATVSLWANLNGCAPSPVLSTTPLDIESSLAGAETQVSRYEKCAPQGAAELWTIAGGTHAPKFSDAFLPRVFDFFDTHRRSP